MRTATGHFEIDNGKIALARTIDFVCLASAFAISTWTMTFLSGWALFVWPAPGSSDIAGYPAQYVVLLLATLITWSVVTVLFHGVPQSDSATVRFGWLMRAGLLWMTTVPLVIFLLKLQEVSRVFVLSYTTLAIILITAGNWGHAIFLRSLLRRGAIHRTALIIGNGMQASWLRQYLLDNYCPEPYIVVRQADPADLDHSSPGSVGGVGRKTTFQHITETFVAAADLGTDPSGLLPRLFERGTKAHIVPGIFDTSLFRLALNSVGGIPIITVQSGVLTGFEAGLKHTFDFIAAGILLLVAAPLFGLIAALVKLSSPGPVFFRQERIGKGGTRIHIYKFRTMRADAEDLLRADPELYRMYVANSYKLPKGKDPRITSIGRVLRQLSLDEIPQLINVLKGEMSLVGPRPVVPSEVEKYGDFAPLLLSVQPGLTGQWQVSGRSNIADYASRVRLDMEYIRDQSLTGDLRILFRTVPVVLSREGAH